MVLTGIVADLINSSRSILEDVSFRLRRMETAQRTTTAKGPAVTEGEAEGGEVAS